MISEIQNQNSIETIMLLSSLIFIFGHNLWLVSDKETEVETKIKINTGDDFPDGETAISPERIANFKIHSFNGEQSINDYTVEETSLTTTISEKPNTPFIASIELLAHPITLEADRFAHYIEDEDAQIFTAPQFIIRETTEPQRESYAKFAKVLVKNNAENTEFLNQPIGQKFEIILLEIIENKARVKVLFEGNPLQNLRVSSGAENLNGGRYITHTRTDENGLAEIEITQNGHCYIRTHYISRHSDAKNFDWESFWASITFYN
jgi:hypothetical protein